MFFLFFVTCIVGSACLILGLFLMALMAFGNACSTSRLGRCTGGFMILGISILTLALAFGLISGTLR